MTSGAFKNPYPMGEVVGVSIYRTDVLVHRGGTAPDVHDRTRGEIKEFSAKSRARLAFVASNTEVEFRTMITLTYPGDFPSDGRKVKSDLNKFLQWVTKDQGRCSVLWFLEFQQRGAPHVHCLYSFGIPRNADERRGLRFRVSAAWYRIVGSGDVRHLQAGTRTERIRKRDGARHYAVKYAAKMHQKEVPASYRNVGRFWGCSRDVPPAEQPIIRCTDDDVRGVLHGWQFEPSSERPIFRVLFNQADRFRDRDLDKPGVVDKPVDA